MNYTPVFTCPSCGEPISTEVGTGETHGMKSGFLPVCKCREFFQNWEKEHRAKQERAKKTRIDPKLRRYKRGNK